MSPSGGPPAPRAAPAHLTLRQADAWADVAVEALAAEALAAAAAVLTAEGRAPAPGEVAVVFAEDGAMHALNRQYRGKDAPTNVLAFPAASPGPPGAPGLGEPPLGEPPLGDPPLGDIVLAFDTIAAEAAAGGGAFLDHLTHLIIHGYLHLQGYDHQTDDEARLMERLERDALARLGRPDPDHPSSSGDDAGGEAAPGTAARTARRPGLGGLVKMGAGRD